LIAGQDCQVFNLVVAAAAAVRAIVADERPIAEKQKIGIGIQKGTTRVASEAVDVPSVASLPGVS
jgi:hypothetical protein